VQSYANEIVALYTDFAANFMLPFFAAAYKLTSCDPVTPIA